MYLFITYRQITKYLENIFLRGNIVKIKFLRGPVPTKKYLILLRCTNVIVGNIFGCQALKKPDMNVHNWNLFSGGPRKQNMW